MITLIKMREVNLFEKSEDNSLSYFEILNSIC